MQSEPLLHERGNRRAGAIVQRGAGPIEIWTRIADVVKAELAQWDQAGQGDGSSAATLPLPVMTCGEIVAALEPAYRTQRAAEDAVVKVGSVKELVSKLVETGAP